jgi:hypothetical protein
VIEVAYGEKIVSAVGEELLSWNGEVMHLYGNNIVKFWFVDVFNFRSLILFLLLSLCSHAHSPLHTKLASRGKLQVRVICQYHEFPHRDPLQEHWKARNLAG